MIKRFSLSKLSFRTKALFVSFGLQCLFIVIFASSVLYIVADQGAAALRGNLEAESAGYARNAAFVFIGSLEENRVDYLTAAISSPSIETAFLLSRDGAILAIADDEWRRVVNADLSQTQFSERRFTLDRHDYWLFIEPVFAVDPASCPTYASAAKECETSQELLGYFGTVGSKALIFSLFNNVAAIVVVAAILLLALIYWSTNRLADRLYRPMLDLAKKTMATADRGYRERLSYSGPVEVETIAAAINHLIGQASQKAGELEQMVAEKTKEERDARKDAEDARAFAERVKEWRTDLMAVNTHELLTPLRILIGELDRAMQELRFLEAGRTRDAIAKRIGQMRAPIQRIEEIVEQVNIAMRIEEGRVDVRPTLDRVPALMRRLERLYGPEALRRNNALSVRCDVTEPILIDHRMVETIASNLVSNACKFTTNGRIDLAARRENGVLEITCRDTGMGIPADRKAMIFEPLYQADMSSRRVADGLGLGLSIVKGYVDRLGGSIKLDSRDGAGTNIRIRLPLPAENSDITNSGK